MRHTRFATANKSIFLTIWTLHVQEKWLYFGCVFKRKFGKEDPPAKEDPTAKEEEKPTTQTAPEEEQPAVVANPDHEPMKCLVKGRKAWLTNFVSQFIFSSQQLIINTLYLYLYLVGD